MPIHARPHTRVFALTRPRRAGLLASAALLSLAGMTAAAHAQAPATGAAAAGQLSEIIVTASKRETDIQKTPLAITAISNDTLNQTHVVNAVDLNGLVPSLVISTSEGFERNVAIRGIGFNVPQNDAAQPSVSYHVDGVYIVNPVSLNTGFLDVNHVEVVRGPQGTVYGQNSTGGTLNVVNNLPSLERANGWAKVDGGNFNLAQFEGAINAPLYDTFAARVAIQGVHHDGFAKATKVAGGDFDLSDEDSFHGRLTTLWKPTAEFSLMLRAEGAYANNHNTEGKSLFDPDPDPWRQSSDWPGRIHYHNELFSATATYDLGFATVKALGSYQNTRQNGSINEDGLDLPTAIKTFGIPGYDAVHDIEYLYHQSKAYTGEVDIASPSGQKLEWIVGAFYLWTKYDVAYDQYSVNSYPVAGQPTSLPNQIFTNPQSEAELGLGGFNFYPYFYSISQLKRDSYSVYGQATYHVTDALRITGGLRQTHDHNTNHGVDYTDLSFGAQATANALTGKIDVEYDLLPKTTGYVSYATGFKPGGGNISAQPIVIGFQYGPEKVKAYEAGLKSTFMDNMVRLNLAGFYYDYNDLQFEAEDSVAYQGGVDNIPKAHVYGIEAETSVILPANFRFDGSLSVEDSKITSHFLALDNVISYAADKAVFAANPPSSFFYDPAVRQQDINARKALYRDVYGNQIPNLPHVTAQGTLSHTDDLGSGTLTESVNGQYRSSYINAVYGDEIQVVGGKAYHIYKAPSYSLWNLYFAYRPSAAMWEVSLAVKNAFNQHAVLGQFTNQFGGETTRQYAPPRQVIGSVSYRF